MYSVYRARRRPSKTALSSSFCTCESKCILAAINELARLGRPLHPMIEKKKSIYIYFFFGAQKLSGVAVQASLINSPPHALCIVGRRRAGAHRTYAHALNLREKRLRGMCTLERMRHYGRCEDCRKVGDVSFTWAEGFCMCFLHTHARMQHSPSI